jgi:hypothetical protein
MVPCTTPQVSMSAIQKLPFAILFYAKLRPAASRRFACLHLPVISVGVNSTPDGVSTLEVSLTRLGRGGPFHRNGNSLTVVVSQSYQDIQATKLLFPTRVSA